MSELADASRRLHVLTLTPFFPSDKNEVSGCFVAEAIDQLKHFGVESKVIAVSPIHYPKKHAGPGVTAEWVRYLQVPGNLGLSSAGKLLYARLLGRVRGLHNERPIDLIHAHAALPCGHAAALLSRRLHIPFVVTLHGLDVFNTGYLGGIPAAWRRNVSVQVYREAQNVICVSGKVQETLKGGTPPEIRTTVVYNGVNPVLFSPSPTQGEKEVLEILVVGNLLASKGHDLVLRTLKKLTTLFQRVRCLIIGEGPDRARLDSLVRELGLGEHVQFVGRKNRLEVAEAMKKCSVFVLPSQNEGLGCVYLEAMSCGKPAIGCCGQGIGEVIEHGKNGWLISPDGLEELVQGLSDLLGSPELRMRIGAAARQTILEKLTLSHQAKQMAKLYRQSIV
jgi:teichuronic acid biosynthesis glycosyltransferase TuaC